MVDSLTSICPYCGKPLKNKFEKIIGILKRFFARKQNRIKCLVSLAVIIVIGVAGYILVNNNEFSKYTKYIGKSYEKLPDGFEFEKWDDEGDLWIAYPETDQMIIGGLRGRFAYSYTMLGSPEDDANKKEIFALSWNSDEETINSENIDEIKEVFTNAYGDYDAKETDNGDYGDWMCETFEWYNKQNLDVSLEITSFDVGEISYVAIFWSKSTK